MADVIQLLPDAIANQIAAGEVVQRPASVVKELIENAVDAGSTEIKLVVKDAGKSLIQVIDNGCGMSETDARMCFERHATSKIRESKDLFSIRTMGFRGEAMASIAAIAHVDLRTRREQDEMGTMILIEGSKLTSHEPCQSSTGTKISVKNLFFNVPARRNFLKSSAVEMRHIIDEFQRVAMAHPDIFFSLYHNGTEMFHLPAGNLRQRIVGILGQHVNKKLVPVHEETDILTIKGYVGKAEYAKKTRGEQFFFVNDRFIKSGYLNHAVMNAFEDLIPKGSYPLYVLFFEMEPEKLDINIHPTKQEIKFEDERLVYNYLKVTVRHALAQYNVTPTLDFDADPTFAPQMPQYPKKETSTVSPRKTSHSSGTISPQESRRQRNNLQNWQQLYEGLGEEEEKLDAPKEPLTFESKASAELDDENKSFSKEEKPLFQIHNTYIISQVKSGFMLIDQQAAHERILFEKYLKPNSKEETSTQKELFSRTFTFSPSDAAILRGMLEDLNLLGFDVRELGTEAFVIHGVPAGLPEGINEQELIESILEQHKMNLDVTNSIQEIIAMSLARRSSVKKGQVLQQVEMQEIIDQLFACGSPMVSPSGKKTFLMLEMEEILQRFGA